MRHHPLAIVALAAAAAAPAAVQSPGDATSAVVEHAGRYVDAYVEAFSAVVSEERQTQTLTRADGRVKKTCDITSDFLLVRARGTWPDAYRDVIDVDGKPVRNREDRLKKLFLEHPKRAPELADAIARESGRYNLGVARRGNSPLLPLIFLTRRIAEGVRFSGTASALAFEETRRPTVLTRRSGSGGDHNMPAHGTFEIEPGTGRVLAATFAVRYAIDPALQICVPVEVTERYWRPGKPDEDVLSVHATYSSFRKFQVTTVEAIKK